MQTNKKNGFLHIPYRWQQAALFGIVVILCMTAFPASAAWNQPTCNPDDVGPTHPSCNVAAPLNTSAAAQTKIGPLTIQNTAGSAALVVDHTLGVGDGNVAITTIKNESLDITHLDPVSEAVHIETNSSAPGMMLIQAGTGGGMGITTSGDNAIGLNIGATGNGTTGMVVDTQFAANAKGISISVDNNGTGMVVADANTGIFTEGTKVALEAIGVGGGLAGRLHSNTNNMAVLIENTGGGHGLDVEAGGVSAAAIPVPVSLAPPARDGVRATSDNGYGVIGYTTGATNGAGVLGLASDDYGVVGWAENDHGVYGNSESAAGFYGGLFCNQRTNCAALGGPVYAGNFDGHIYATGTMTIATDSVNPILVVDNANANGEGVKVHVQTGSLSPIAVPASTAVDAQSFSGIGVYAYSETKTALRAEGSTGARFISDGGKAVEIVAPSGGTGVEINTDNYAYALRTMNGGIIQNRGAFEGGQFYPYEYTSEGVHQATSGQILFEYSTAFNAQTDIAFDGSDIWVSQITDKIFRMNAVDNRLVNSYSTSVGLRPMVILYIERNGMDPTIYVLGENQIYDTFPVYGDTGTLGQVINGLPAGELIEEAVYDGDSIWLSTDARNIYDWPVFSGGPAQYVTTTVSQSHHMLYANGKVYATDAGADGILKIDPFSHIVSLIPAENAYGIAFDGQYLWTTDYWDHRLNRTNIVTEQTTSYDISAPGTTPRAIAFDGTYLWITYDGTFDGVAPFNVAKKRLGSPTATGPSPRNIVFDGTNVWIPHYIGEKLTKLSTGAGMGYGATPVTKGFYLWGQDSKMYCVYVDNTGTLQYQDVSITDPCQ